MFVDSHIAPLYHATIEATEAAIVNALLAAETTTGRRGVTDYGLEPERLLEAMRQR
jgi:L-aminopeptidase/D-esterase-like protein